MKTAKIINQGISLLLATMLLLVAGGRSWSDLGNSLTKEQIKASQFDRSAAEKGGTRDSGEAKISTLSLDAVVTPAISFDFNQYFYFIPQPVWHFAVLEAVVRFTFQESFFLHSYFNRIFGRFIVTNAP